jgi:hypothetical protein
MREAKQIAIYFVSFDASSILFFKKATPFDTDALGLSIKVI